MTEAMKTVFVSYRRSVSSYIARAIYQNLTDEGYDVFIDVESIASGAFDTVILKEIAQRQHFVVILTPGTVERCVSPDDWLRREIEHAMALHKNIVPVVSGDFDFAGAERYLTGKLSGLSRYNSLPLYHDYFDEAMVRLRNRYLKQTGPTLKEGVETLEVDAVEAEQGDDYNPGSFTSLVVSPEVHLARALTHQRRGNADRAMTEYGRAIKMKPNFAPAFCHRGELQLQQEKTDEALKDLTEAIRLKPDFSLAYRLRGQTYLSIDQPGLAMSDLRKANDLLPADHATLATIAITEAILGDHREAERLWGVVIKINEHYKDLEWIKKEFNWNGQLITTTEKLLSRVVRT